MKGIVKKINFNEFKTYLFFSVILLATLVAIRSFDFTLARYESEVSLDASPALAFFIVDVGTTSGQIKLASMVPRDEPYTYTFNVSNFQNMS